MRLIGHYFGATLLVGVVASYAFPADIVFTVSPVKLEPEAPRGGVADIGLTVINESPLQGQAFKIYLTDLTMDLEGKAVFPPAGTTEWSAAPWIELDRETLELPPLGRSVVIGKIRVPRNIKTGGARFAAIMVQAVEPEPEGQIKIVVQKRAAAFVYLTIRNSQQLRLAEIAEFTGALAPSEGYTFSTLLANQGNIHIQAVGNLSIIDKDYRRWGQAILAETPKTLFPGAVRKFQALIQRRLPVGDYTARATFYYGRSRAYKEIPFTVTEAMAGQAGTLPIAVMYEPEAVTFEAPPGAFRRQVLKYKSYEQTPVKLKIDTASQDEVDSRWSAVPWIESAPADITLGPGQSRNITLLLRLPEDAEGERFAKLVSAGQLQDEEPTKWETPVVVTIPGTLAAKGRITQLEMLEPATGSSSFVARVGFENSGNARLNLTGIIRVLKMEKFEEVASAPFEETVFPSQETTVEVPLPWGLPINQYVAAATVTGVTSDDKSRVQDTRTVEFTVDQEITAPEFIEEIQEGETEDEIL